MTFSEWLATKIGRNWVQCRRTARAVARYGEDATYLTQARYAALQAEYERETGLSAMGYLMPPGAPARSRVAAAFPGWRA